MLRLVTEKKIREAWEILPCFILAWRWRGWYAKGKWVDSKRMRLDDTRQGNGSLKSYNHTELNSSNSKQQLEHHFFPVSRWELSLANTSISAVQSPEQRTSDLWKLWDSKSALLNPLSLWLYYYQKKISNKVWCTYLIQLTLNRNNCVHPHSLLQEGSVTVFIILQNYRPHVHQ